VDQMRCIKNFLYPTLSMTSPLDPESELLAQFNPSVLTSTGAVVASALKTHPPAVCDMCSIRLLWPPGPLS
jgi:hypothetical protein